MARSEGTEVYQLEPIQMKIHLKLAVIAALCLSAGAQTPQATTQSWVTIVPAQQQAVTLTVRLPAGTTFRLVIDGVIYNNSGFRVQGDTGFYSFSNPDTSMQVLQIQTPQSVSLIDSSVTPAKTTRVIVPALPPALPGPTTIWTGTASNTDLAGRVTLSGGSATQALTGPYSTPPIVTCSDTTALAAVKCVASTTAITFTGTGTDVINYILIGPDGPRGIVRRGTVPKGEEHDKR
jgi:hypothetical protein